MIIRHWHVFRVKARATIARVYTDIAGEKWHCPEKAIRANARIKVVDLTRLVKHVQSDKPEYAVSVLTVLRDILAHHEAHVHFPVQVWRDLVGN